MRIPRRLERQRGRYALVDGIPFTLPVDSRDTPALMAAFPIDGAKARTLLPGDEIHPVRLWGDRGLLVITVVNYTITDIGNYIEFSIGIACTHGDRSAPPLLPGVLPRVWQTGQFVVDLPVSTEISVKGGKGIWGMPKHQANLDFEITDQRVWSQYDLDGQLCMRIEIDRPRIDGIPLSMAAVNYCQFRGMLMKSRIFFSDDVEVAFGPRAHGELRLGPHPRMDPLRGLDVSSSPLFVACLPHSHGILDDHVEGWFLTSAAAPDPAHPPEGLESVVGLPNDETWLPAPAAEGR